MRCIKLFVALSFNWKQMFSRDRKVVYIDKKGYIPVIKYIKHIGKKLRKREKKYVSAPDFFNCQDTWKGMSIPQVPALYNKIFQYGF